MTRRSIAAAAAAMLLALAAPAYATPALTKARVKLTRRDEVRVNARGALDAETFGSPTQIVVRVGSLEETLPLDGFRYAEKRRRYVWKGEKTALVRRAVFDLKKGVFRLKCRSGVPGDYADPIVLGMGLALDWTFDVPIDADRRVSRFKGELKGATELQTSFEGGSPLTGEVIPVVFLVKDDRSRAVDLAIEYSEDGGDTWHAATQRPGDAPPLGVPATPEGVQVNYYWRMYDDLGCGWFENVLLRAVPTSAAGHAEPGALDVPVYGEVLIEDLGPELLDDIADGTLDSFGLLDVRGVDAYDAGHIPGAVNIPVDTIPDPDANPGDPDPIPYAKDRRLILYCDGGLPGGG